jgi:hypothetical protein
MGALNVDPEVRIELRFSEQMQRETVEAALQFWPAPPGEYEVETSWRWLRVTFDEALEPSTTYLLTLDKRAADLRKNGLAETYILAFSTGDSLNKGYLHGFVEGGKDLWKSGELRLYRDYQLQLDSLRYQRADYVFQSSDSGSYAMPYLAKRVYLLFYHWDRNSNSRIDAGDFFGRPAYPTVLPQPSKLAAPIGIWPQLVPAEQVKLLKAELQQPDLLKIRFRSPVQSASLEKLEVHSPAGRNPLKGATLVPKDDFAALVHLGIPLMDSSEVWVQGFVDSAGTTLNSDTLLARAPLRVDTLELDLSSLAFRADPDGNPAPDKGLELRFNHPVIAGDDSIFSIQQVKPDTVILSGELEQVSSTLWHWLPDSGLRDGASFAWELQTAGIKPYYAVLPEDSLFTGRLTTLSRDSLGGIIITQDLADIVVGEIRSKKYSRSFSARRGAEVTLEGLPSGFYRMRVYADLDGDGDYDAGGRLQNQAAEPFWVYPQPIRVRARWDIDLGIWDERTR